MAGELQTTVNFSDGDQATSTKLDEIISGASFTSSAVTGTTLTVVGGKLKVGTITESEMGADSVGTTALIADSVVTAVIADEAVTYAKVDTGSVASAADINAGTASKLVDAAGMLASALVPKAYCLTTISSSARTIGNNFGFASTTRSSATKTTFTFASAQSDTGYNVMVSARSSDGSGTANLVVSNPTATSFDVTHPTEGAPWVSISVVVFNI